MNILVIMGSPRKGETLAVVRQVEAQMQALGEVSFDYLWLRDANLPPCRGCHACVRFGEQKCPLRDDTASIEARMLAADGIILATPVYCQQVSYLMKTFLDRYAYWWHRPRFFGKVFLPVASGGGQFKSTLSYLAECVSAWGGTALPGLGAAHIDSLVPKARARLEKQIGQSAARFFQTVQGQMNGAPLPAPSLYRLIWFRMWRINARANKAFIPADYRYWTEQGWFEREYYTKQPLNFFQRTVGRVMEPLLRNMLRGVYEGY